ncbi:MAG TPA: hypothetical protein VKV02_08500 [Acidobacteriaceae bacterium]|nr:hypothetical protein [Acidobacteriaceae bacterium]
MRRYGCGVLAAGFVIGMTLSSGAQTQSPAPGTDASATGTSAAGGGRRGQYAGMGRAMGEVTAVAGNTVTLKAEDGTTTQVITTDNTRVVKDRGPVKVSDLHPGDGLMAVGNLDGGTKTLHAAMIFAEDAAQVKAMRDNLGKTYITGRVTAIDLDNAKMTVERADHVAQTIGFDEGTSFKRAVRGGGGPRGEAGPGDGGAGTGRGPGNGMGMGGMAVDGGIDRAFTNGESITLADVKVGDYVAATGTVKAGTFVPVHFVDSPPGARRARSGAGPGGAGAAGAPAAGTPPGPGER